MKGIKMTYKTTINRGCSKYSMFQETHRIGLTIEDSEDLSARCSVTDPRLAQKALYRHVAPTLSVIRKTVCFGSFL